MNGRGVGELKLYRQYRSDVTDYVDLWSISGSQGYHWNKHEFTVHLPTINDRVSADMYSYSTPCHANERGMFKTLPI